MEKDAHTIDDRLGEIARRLWAVRALEVAVSFLMLALAPLAAAAVVVRIWAGASGLGVLAAAVAVVVVLALAGALAVAARRRPSRFDAAVTADLELGTQERLATWVEYRSRKRRRLFGEALAADAVSAARDRSFDEVARVRVPERARWLVLPLAVLTGAFLLQPETLDRSLFGILGLSPGEGGGRSEKTNSKLDAGAAAGRRRLLRRAASAEPVSRELPAGAASESQGRRLRHNLLTREERRRLLDALRRGTRAFAEARAAEGGDAGDRKVNLDYVKVRGAGRVDISAGGRRSAMWRWRFPEYRREIADYMSAGPL